MYSDLFDQLGGGAGGAGGGRVHHRHGAAGSDDPRSPPPLVSFKAGKLELQPKEGGSGSYMCTSNTSRGEVRLVWKLNVGLTWQWYDRREKRIVDSATISDAGGTFERVVLNDKQHKDDRIYVWTQPKKSENANENSAAASNANPTSDAPSTLPYKLYWMQDALHPEKDDEIVAQVNQYLADPSSAAPAVTEAATATTTNNTGGGATRTATSAGGAGTTSASSSASNAQVDMLSSILENIGMPQESSTGGGISSATGGGSASRSGGAAGSSTNNTGGTLTLADLQGAMASVQQQATSASSSERINLAEIVTPAAISSLLERDDVCERLMEQLPPEQRGSRQDLEDNLRSPQVQQTLRMLTSILLPDDHGNLDGLYSVLANFSLDPADGQEAILNRNPIQAFLDAIIKSVEKEKSKEKEEASAAAAGGEEAKDSTTDDKKEGGGGGGEESKQPDESKEGES